MNSFNILVVDDNKELLDLISCYLTNAGYCVDTAANSKDAIKKVKEKNYQLFILDVIIPGIDGIKLCEIIREVSSSPIFFISCLDSENDILKAFDAGGNDYIRKPFSLKELLARVKATSRSLRYHQFRVKNSNKRIDTIRQLSIDMEASTIYVNNKDIHLSPMEFKILLFMIENANIVLTYSDIYNSIWKTDSVGDTRTVMVHVSNLRKKIESHVNEKYISTIYGKGYIFHC